MLGTLTLQTFLPCVGGAFRLTTDDGGTFDLELIEAAAPRSGPGRGGASRPGKREPFSLLFRGPSQPVLPQRIYPLRHDTLGTLELFLVPVGPDDKGLCYEAVFG